MSFSTNKIRWKRNCLSLPKGTQYSMNQKQCNDESLRTNVNENVSKFKDSVIQEFDALNCHFWHKLIPL